MEDTTTISPSVLKSSFAANRKSLWSRVEHQLDQVAESLDLLRSEESSRARTSGFFWPDGKPSSEPYSCGLEGEQRLVLSPDGMNAYLSSSESSFLIAFRCDRKSGELREYSRVQLGFTKAGVSSIASGGVWVFVACEQENRVLVLRLCHDWYQDRSRLLLMRVVHEAGGPKALAATRDGRLVAVTFRSERIVRVYHCRMNGRLELCAQHYLTEDIEELDFSPKPETLTVRGRFGIQSISLESIF